MAKLPTKNMMKDAGTKVEKRLQARRSSVELSNLNILTTAENDKDHGEIVSDAVARRRNSSVELTRMLESRPMFLPDGRSTARRGSAEAIEKALENRPDIEELKVSLERQGCTNVADNICSDSEVSLSSHQSKNIMQDHETEKVEEKARARRQSISLISDIIAKEASNKENKSSVVAEIKKPMKPKKKKGPRAIIPKRPYHGAPTPSMNNTASWNYAGGLNYATQIAASRRSAKLSSMAADRDKAHASAARAAKVSPEAYYGKYGKRDVSAPRYPPSAFVMDRRKTEHMRQFVWPGYTPT